MNTIKPNPRVMVPGAAGYLLWLKQDLPAVYAAVLQKFPQVAAFDARASAILKGSGLGFDWSSVSSALSTAASDVGSSLSSVGSFVASNAPAILTTGAGLYGLIAKQQMMNTQLQLAQSGQYPQQTGFVQSPGNQPYLTGITSNGYTSGLSSFSSLLTGTIAGIPTWVFLGAAVGGSLLLAKRSRK